MPTTMQSTKQKLKTNIKNNLAFVTETDPVSGDPNDYLDKFAEAIAQAVTDTILNDMIIQIPAASVIIQVTGQAAGVPNVAPINCTIL